MPDRLALVVDDHPTNRILACALLKKLGWTPHEVDSAEQALQLASHTPFGLILLDISMPGMSGEAACPQLRDLLGSAVRIIAYTAHAFPEERARFLAAGFDDILVKPISREKLEKLIAQP